MAAFLPVSGMLPPLVQRSAWCPVGCGWAQKTLPALDCLCCRCEVHTIDALLVHVVDGVGAATTDAMTLIGEPGFWGRSNCGIELGFGGGVAGNRRSRAAGSDNSGDRVLGPSPPSRLPSTGPWWITGFGLGRGPYSGSRLRRVLDFLQDFMAPRRVSPASSWRISPWNSDVDPPHPRSRRPVRCQLHRWVR